MSQNKNWLSEIILMASLKGDVIKHAEFLKSAADESKGGRFSFQFNFKGDLITLQYWKEGDDLTFITGTYHERDLKLGTLISALTPQKLYKLLSL